MPAAALITTDPVALVRSFGTIPARITIAGMDVHAPHIGWESSDGRYRLVELVYEGVPPGPYVTVTETTTELVDDQLVVTNVYAERLPTQAELLAYAANKRAAKAAAGTKLGETPIPTDLDTRTLLLGFYVKSLATPGFTVQWRTPTGMVTLNATNIQAAAQQVGLFLGQCLNAENLAIAGIQGSPQTITTTVEVDALFEGF